MNFKQQYNSSKEILGTNLQFYRKQRNISQRKLSLRTHLQRSYLAELEMGKRNPTISKIFQIAIGFHMEPWHLLKPITYNEWMYEKESHFTPCDLTLCPTKLLTPEKYKMALINHIKYLRTERGWLQRDLAEYSDLSEIFIRYIELGEKEPTLDSLDKISAAFTIETWTLVNGVDPNTIWIENKMWH